METILLAHKYPITTLWSSQEDIFLHVWRWTYRDDCNLGWRIRDLIQSSFLIIKIKDDLTQGVITHTKKHTWEAHVWMINVIKIWSVCDNKPVTCLMMVAPPELGLFWGDVNSLWLFYRPESYVWKHLER